MRRIIFGAIWLTGFLAVLLAWGMMWGRAQGEGPRRMIGKTWDTPNGFQMGMTMPGSRLWRPIASDDLAFRVLGWSENKFWLYYMAVYEENYDTDTSTYRIGRVDASLHHKEILLDGVMDTVFLSPEAKYIVFKRGSQNIQGQYEVNWYSVTSDGKNLHNLTSQFHLEWYPALPVFDPSGEWLVLQAYQEPGNSDDTDLYRIALDGHLVEQIREFPSNHSSVILWTDAPEWLILQADTNEIYKMRPDGSDLTQLTFTQEGPQYVGWVHQTGIVGLLEGDIFSAVRIDTMETLWRLAGVQKVFTESGGPANLNNDWLHFQMTDGRLARCRFSSDELTFYNTQNLRMQRVRQWSSDGNWVLIETDGPDLGHVAVVGLQANTNNIKYVYDTANSGSLVGWSPDGKWLYYYDFKNDHLRHVKIHGGEQSQIVSTGAFPYSSTPPYQAEWQPTHTLAIGIGLMSFSTLTPIVLWRRRHKPRTT